MFENIVSKLGQDQISTFFNRFFQDEHQLQTLNKGSFRIFNKIFIKINELLEFIDRKYTESYTDGYPPRR